MLKEARGENEMTLEEYQELLKKDRRAAIGILAKDIFESYDLDDFVVFWQDIHSGAVKFGPLHRYSDEVLAETYEETL